MAAVEDRVDDRQAAVERIGNEYRDKIIDFLVTNGYELPTNVEISATRMNAKKNRSADGESNGGKPKTGLLHNKVDTGIATETCGHISSVRRTKGIQRGQ